MKKSLFLITLLALLTPLLPISAQETQGTLRPMDQRTAALAAGDSHFWEYVPNDIDATILVEPINGSLDPTLEVLDAEGEVIATNEDFAASFSPAAALFIESDEAAGVRVNAAHGEGSYTISIIPGDVLLHWLEDFEGSGVDWTEFVSAQFTDGKMRLQTPMWEAKIYTPRSAPALTDLYIQTTLRFEDVRENSQGGLVLRGRIESNNETTALHLLVNAEKTWTLEASDITGTDTILESGTLTDAGDEITLGMLAVGDTVQVFAEGEYLTEVENAPSDRFTLWGIEVVNSIITFDDIWLGLPVTEAPEFPEELRNWNSANSAAIAAELIEGGILREGSQRRLALEPTTYTVGNYQQRNFVVGEENVIFDDMAIGAQVYITDATDTGCGVLARHLDDANQVIAFVDSQSGVGLLWWEHDQLVLNDYALIEPPAEPVYDLLLILVDHYAALYVNGQLIAQNMIARRVGDVGLSFINYANAPATCLFRNFWVWN